MCADISKKARIIGDAEFSHCLTFLTTDSATMASERRGDLGDRLATHKHFYNFCLPGGQSRYRGQLARVISRLSKRFNDGAADVYLPLPARLNRLPKLVECLHFAEHAEYAV
ncbi:hypothetical protein R69619_00996 [Paraburkholderia nemoris]|nr:hypothetical protein R69619_00996 [Paraburkholderia nemoris]